MATRYGRDSSAIQQGFHQGVHGTDLGHGFEQRPPLHLVRGGREVERRWGGRVGRDGREAFLARTCWKYILCVLGQGVQVRLLR